MREVGCEPERMSSGRGTTALAFACDSERDLRVECGCTTGLDNVPAIEPDRIGGSMRRTNFIASGIIGCATLLALSAPAFAAEYGAIAYDTGSGRMGWSWHGPSVAQANTSALSACASAGCKTV